MNRWPHSKTSLLSSSDRLDALHTAYSSRAAVELFIYFGLWDREVESSQAAQSHPSRSEPKHRTAVQCACNPKHRHTEAKRSVFLSPSGNAQVVVIHISGSGFFFYFILFFCNRCQKLSRRIACFTFNATMRYALVTSVVLYRGAIRWWQETTWREEQLREKGNRTNLLS